MAQYRDREYINLRDQTKHSDIIQRLKLFFTNETIGKLRILKMLSKKVIKNKSPKKMSTIYNV